MEKKKECDIFSANPQQKVPATAITESHFLFLCCRRIGQIHSLMPRCKGAKRGFLFLRFSNQKLFQGAYNSEQLHRHQELKYKPAGRGDAVKRNLKIMTKKKERIDSSAQLSEKK